MSITLTEAAANRVRQYVVDQGGGLELRFGVQNRLQRLGVHSGCRAHDWCARPSI